MASRPANPGSVSWSREVPFAHLLQTPFRGHRRHDQDEGQCGSVSPSAVTVAFSLRQMALELARLLSGDIAWRVC